MPDQALFAYKVQLPDGSEAVRTGGADRAPTYGELADYAANQGERFLGHVPMSPAPMPPPPDTAPAPVPSGGLGTAEAATLPTPAPPAVAAPSVASQARQTFLPDRSLTSEGLSIGGGIAGGMLGAAVPVAGPFVAPLAAGAGSALGEAAQVGAENLFGWPAAEPGTLGERTTRAAIRGAAGEGVGQVVRVGGRLVGRAVGPTLKAAEEVAPALEQAVPAGVKGVPTVAGEFAPVSELLSDPAKLAATELTPKGQDTLTRVFWQQNAPQGAGAVVNAWDQLGTAGQQAMAGAQHAPMSTLVESLRPGLEPLTSITMGQAARTGAVPGLVWYAGHPHAAAALATGSELMSRYAPRAFLSPTAGPLLAQLPAVGRAVAAPADFLLRAGGQYVGNEAFP